MTDRKIHFSEPIDRRTALRDMGALILGGGAAFFLPGCGRGDNSPVIVKTQATATATAIPASDVLTATPVRTATSTPTESPVAKAIDSGKIELKEPQEWEKYFVAVTPAEATALKTDGKIILPFDPRLSKNLEMEVFQDFFDGIRVLGLGFNNIGLGTVIYAPADGEGWVSSGGFKFGKVSASVNAVIGDNFSYALIVPDKNLEPIGRSYSNYSARAAVTLGEPTARYTNNAGVLLGQGKSYQAVYTLTKMSDYSYDSVPIDRFATKDGKIAFIAAPSK